MVKHKLIVSGLLFGIIGTACESPQGISQKELIKQSLNEYYRGEEFENQRALERAEQSYLASIQTSPRPRVWYRLAEVEKALGKHAEAKYAVQNAIKMVPDYPQAVSLNAELEASYPDLEPIMPVSSIPLSAVSGDFSPEIADRTINQFQEQDIISQDSVTQIKSGTMINELSIENQQAYQEALALSQNGDWGTSADMLGNLLLQYPDAPEILYHYGYALFNLNEIEAAAEMFEKSVELDSTNASAFNDLGVTYERLGRPSDAVIAYEKAILIGRHVDAYYNLALLNEKLGEYKAAIKLYEEYLKYDSVSVYANTARDRIKRLQRTAY